ncbi:cytochrome P450 [Mycolicibacterium sp. BiH015]|uniref:cytochrome P450 n=1 Tax=Mycolicibacterium sp. BiH015 TaxID=3018808 RepID=UPI0022E0AC17|nr:cytochrome P450 [Mycolicibacterium sp. BiH015]MDA2892342.1 cytochrome P450 [Mycolicibacterium sp. BiH015]
MTGEAPRLGGVEAAVALADLGLPSIAAGVLARRRRVVGLLDRVDADARGVKRVQELRRRFGAGPVVLTIPGRKVVVPLDPADVADVLDHSPYPFDPASWEKTHALQQFQPNAVLISRGDIREKRRRVNEAALDTGAELHRLAEAFQLAVNEECARFAADALRTGGFDSAQFVVAWWRLARRLVLGADAADDESVTDDLWKLRTAGNWSFLNRQHPRRRARFFARLYRYAENPDANSLLGALASVPSSGAVDPIGQVPHWLFAFDAAGMAALRALALLTTHEDRRRLEDTQDPDAVRVRPYLRAAVLESVRLWPTTPAILREIAAETTWHQGTSDEVSVSPPGTVLIPVPAFHRDPDLLPFADEFTPDIWLDGRAKQYPQLVPFSAGPAVCPGRDLVLFATSSVLAALLSRLDLRLRSGQSLDPARPLPATLNQFGLSFAAVAARAESSSARS